MQNRFFFLFYIFVVYVLAASLWWGYLLYSKNEQLYKVKIEMYEYKFGTMVDDNEEYKKLQNDSRRQHFMIVSEGIVYFSILVIFVLVVIRSVRKEMALTQQQRNFILSITHLR